MPHKNSCLGTGASWGHQPSRTDASSRPRGWTAFPPSVSSQKTVAVCGRGAVHLQRTNIFINTWCWERWRAATEEGIRGWDGWMAPSMQWTWTWANFRRWWGAGRPSCSPWSHKESDTTEWLNNSSTFISGSTVKNLPTMQETCVEKEEEGEGRSSGEGNVNRLQYSCWEIPWTEEPGRL